MGLLDDARQIAGGEPVHAYTVGDAVSWRCDVCWGHAEPRAVLSPFPHKTGCPWLSMPKIVAALEAVYDLMMSEDGAEPIMPAEYATELSEVNVWTFCQRPVGGSHWEGCLWVQLAYLVYGQDPRD